MPETKQLLRGTRDRIAPPPDVFGGLERRRRHQENVKRAAAAAVAIVVALVGVGGWFVLDRDAAQRPAEPPEDLGIFAPVAGRIVYENEAEVGDLGYDPGVWALDPIGPSDTLEGRAVADDVAATLVRLGANDMTPLGWSSDGTELLFMRTDGDQLFPQQYLYILHADGSETQLNRDPMYFGGAAISADGSRIVFAAWGDDLGLYVVDAEGGRPVPLPLPGAEGIVMSPTFSPDGTRIAYLDSGNRENHVWVMDADGGNAREILANEVTQVGGVGDLRWSPAGDRIAGVAGSSEGTNAIYTFAPDGSDFTRVITYGLSPYWSPDGSQIAYTIECPELTSPSCLGGGSAGLAIADADGSNVRAFGFAASGPWHPGVSATDEPVPTPVADRYGIVDGEIAFAATDPPWRWSDLISSSTMSTLLFDDRYRGVRFMADPLWFGRCEVGPAPTDAEALATTILSDPDIEATEAVPVRVAGIEGLQMDVAPAPGASHCEAINEPGLFMDQSGELGVWPGPLGLWDRHRYRLYLLDVPEGSSRVLAILIFALDRDFERIVEAAAPVLDTLEFRTR